MNGLKEYQREKLLSLASPEKEGKWELHAHINHPSQTTIVEIVEGKFKDVVEYALVLEESIDLIKEAKIKKINAYSAKTLAELYSERSRLQNQLKIIEKELQEGDIDYE